MFLSLDLLSGLKIQHGAIGPLYVTSSYSTWIFCRGVSGFATDYPCGVWCRELTTCLLHVGPPFGNLLLNTSWAVGLAYWIVYLHFFVFWHMQLYMSWYIISFLALCLLLKYSLFFKYSCTNIFQRRSFCTLYNSIGKYGLGRNAWNINFSGYALILLGYLKSGAWLMTMKCTMKMMLKLAMRLPYYISKIAQWIKDKRKPIGWETNVNHYHL